MVLVFIGYTFVVALFGMFMFLWGGFVFLWGGLSELRDRKFGMMLLILMGFLVAFGVLVVILFYLIDVELWFELVMLVTIMLFGYWFEMRVIG